jgi:hypothetical protein
MKILRILCQIKLIKGLDEVELVVVGMRGSSVSQMFCITFLSFKEVCGGMERSGRGEEMVFSGLWLE